MYPDLCGHLVFKNKLFFEVTFSEVLTDKDVSSELE